MYDVKICIALYHKETAIRQPTKMHNSWSTRRRNWQQITLNNNDETKVAFYIG